MGRTAEPLRTEQDISQYWPAWFVKLALKVAQFERGHAYDVLVIVPDDGREPTWAVQPRGKVENAR